MVRKRFGLLGYLAPSVLGWLRACKQASPVCCTLRVRVQLRCFVRRKPSVAALKIVQLCPLGLICTIFGACTA